jgi:MoxR-like ATPase
MEAVTPPPLKGYRVLLRGFHPDEETEVRNSLNHYGYQVVSSIVVADALVLGTGSASAAIEAARKARLHIAPWTEFRTRMDKTTTSPTLAPKPAQRGAIEVQADSVRILDVALRRVGSTSPLVPSAGQFRHLCLDDCFLRTARAVATGVGRGFPVALEGDTAASKTTAVLWVAHLLGQPVLRINLHGQSDSGELIGRYVPASSDGEDGICCGHGCREGGASEHRRVHEGAAGNPEVVGRWNKCCPAVETEPPRGAAWRFQEGAIPQAMRHGWWVVLDEMNLAEPQVLERLNPVLEQPPSLVITEGDGTVIGPGGSVVVAPGFQLFGTMNPADYSGRSVLSPAFRDRWLLWHHAEVPGEVGFAAMLRCLLFGEQPEIVFRGVQYRTPPSKPVYPDLGAVPGIRELVPRLALFHASLGHAAGMGGAAPALGRLRRERYVFTRRTLITCLELLNSARAEQPQMPFETQLRDAIEVAYLHRIRDGADRDAAMGLLRASSLCDLDGPAPG